MQMLYKLKSFKQDDSTGHSVYEFKSLPENTRQAPKEISQPLSKKFGKTIIDLKKGKTLSSSGLFPEHYTGDNASSQVLEVVDDNAMSTRQQNMILNKLSQIKMEAFTIKQLLR